MRPLARQRGAALMAMLAVLILGAAWWAVTALSTPVDRTASERVHNARILQEAKSALVGYVAHRAAMTISAPPTPAARDLQPRWDASPESLPIQLTA